MKEGVRDERALWRKEKEKSIRVWRCEVPGMPLGRVQRGIPD